MVFTNTGLTQVRNWLAGTTSTAPLAIAVGTGSTPASVSDTDLVGEVYRDSFSSVDSSASQMVVFEMLMGTTAATGSTIAEFGLFNSTSETSGDLFVRNTFASIQKTDTIEVQFEQRVEVN